MWKISIQNPVGAGIQTHDLWNISLTPLPPHEGSRPNKYTTRLPY